MFIISLAAFFLVSPQIYQHGLIVSNDWAFHMNRFYETAMQIKHGIFSYFQSIYSFNQSGRIVNALYGTDFAYFNGLLLLLSGNWFRFQIASTFLCYFTAGISMYSLSRYCKINKLISIGAAYLYMGTPTIVYYSIAQNFSGWGAAFLPLAFIPAVRMITNKSKPINPVFFGSSIALLISVHMFSTVLAVITLIPFFIIGFINCDNKITTFRDALLAVLISIGLSFNTVASFIDLSSDKLIAPYDVADLFSNSTFLSTGPLGWTNFGLILSLIFTLQIVNGIVNLKRINTLEKIFTFVGGFFLMISSKYFPWNEIGNYFNFVRKMQFPQRFGCIACILLILGFCYSLQGWKKYFSKERIGELVPTLVIVIAILNLTNGHSLISSSASAWNSNNPLSNDTAAAEKLENNPNKIRETFGGNSELGAALQIYRKPTSDYLPVYSENITDSYRLYKEDIFNNTENYSKKVRKDGSISISFDSKSTKEVTIPIIVYKNSTVTINGANRSDASYSLSSIGALKIIPKKGDNHINIGYHPSLLFRLSLIIKGVFVIFTISYFIRYLFLKNNFKIVN